MKQINLLKSLSVLLIVLFGFSVKAQDIIINTDKKEIKAKVLEIEENTIKYKKFEFADGPSYNINKSEVFMIIYKNGTRETFETKSVEAKPADIKAAPTLFATPKPREAKAEENKNVAPAGAVITSETRVNYFPTRLYVSFPVGGFSLSGEREFGLLPNYINSGLGLTTSIFESEYTSSTSYGATIYASGYLPVNRITGNLENQDKGFFPFVRLGAAFTMVDTEVDGTRFSSSSFGISHGVGADYKFSPKFGLSVVMSQFNAFGAGINYRF